MGDKMTQEELKMALELHKKWLSNESDGVRLDLRNADLRGMDLTHANLSYADLSGTNLSYAKLSHADLSNANLTWAILNDANLYLANLSHADLMHANLTLADLSNANCSDADMRFSILSDANLSHADLRFAFLSFAYLSNSILIGANLNDTELRWVNTINTVGLDVICVQLNTSDKNRQIQYYVQLEKVTAGCFSGTLDELKKAVDEKHDKESVIYKRYQIALKTIEDILDTY